MALKSGTKTWGAIAKFFHWTVVILILVEGPLGLMLGGLQKASGPGSIPYFNLHKSIGMTVLALAALRLLWRVFDARPVAVPGMPKLQETGARLGHALLYALIFLVPLSGWWFDSVTGLRPMYWFNLFEVPHLVAPDPALKNLAHEWHERLFWLLALVAAGHAAMALVHHFINRDTTLTRMLPARHKAPLVAALLVLVVAAIALPIWRPSPHHHDHGHGHGDEENAIAATAMPHRDGATASADPGAGDAAAATRAHAWQVDAAQSTLGFSGTYSGEAFQGRFRQFDATIDYDEADLEHSAFDVKIDLASVDTASSERDDTLKGADFFDPKKFGQAHFVTTAFAKDANGLVTAQGKLTIRDQTKPVVLAVKFAAADGKATLDVDTTLKRADFGLGAGTDWNDVGAEVPVHGHLVLSAR